MIFVTVGTHEQQFNRLVRAVDELRIRRLIKEEVFMQIGCSDYLPAACSYERFIPHEKMDAMMAKANIVITHSGPGSIFNCFRYDKIPVVVPRQPEFHEHVDLHQVKFTEFLEKKKAVIAVYDIKDICGIINTYKSVCMNSSCFAVNRNLEYFTKRINEISIELFTGTHGSTP